ncbi:MAG TPA: Asp-tRNA(Asn)/Glu-tRNA(Gln) amidotransferase subunit GatC [Saprospiraceae bacterium]|jgi:aspartyl-tRNA(Asn)/glutamyl-tRNA(Gln) amidotransferase subunit C|nr:Asp-tRNA(Asn)/Glu-tRNA(Gln) amidotransferase subunit GatC [Saprospiraceae bacterium]HMT69280.1 Asp-tRNA(Asn)/Glu-tRNA(Gln) amidotransferase subunit GatC [Saprospiraceae bacterium]
MTVIDDKVISNLEQLSRLKLGLNEKEVLKLELSKIIQMFDKISIINTDGIAPMIHMTANINVFRSDVAENIIEVSRLMSNAPQAVNSYYAVPKVIE